MDRSYTVKKSYDDIVDDGGDDSEYTFSHRLISFLDGLSCLVDDEDVIVIIIIIVIILIM